MCFFIWVWCRSCTLRILLVHICPQYHYYCLRGILPPCCSLCCQPGLSLWRKLSRLLLWHRKLQGWHKHGNEQTQKERKGFRMLKPRSERLRFAGKWQKKKIKKCATWWLTYTGGGTHTAHCWGGRSIRPEPDSFEKWKPRPPTSHRPQDVSSLMLVYTALNANELHVYVTVKPWWVWPGRPVANTCMWCPRKAAHVARDRPSGSGVLE